jgi:LysM repeat protein
MVLKRTLIRLLFLLCFISGLRAQETGVRRSQVVETYRGKQYYIHFVEQGQTLYAISQAYQVTVDDIRHANPDISEMLRDDQILMIPVKDLRATPEPVSKTETPADLPTRDVTDGQRSHIVAPKETWYALARQYNLAVKDIIAANPGVDTLRIGMKVTIPEPVQPDARPGLKLYTVSAQETLYGISRAFGITVDELVGLNPELSNGLQTGQVIYVPDRQPVVQKPAEQPRSRKDGYLEHRVERKETLYSISRRYGVEMTAILNANPGLGGSLRKNEIILIPLPGSSLAGTVKVKQDSVVLGRAVHAEALPELPAMNCTPSHPVKRTFNLALMAIPCR